MKTITYEGVQHGDWVRCVLCGAQMLLPCGADKCPECGENGTLRWVDEERQEMDAKDLDCLGYVRELRIDDYLSPTTDGRDFNRLAKFIPYNMIKDFGMEPNEEYNNEERWNSTVVEFTRENVLKQLEEDVRFGFEKALNQRGISASLMFECVMMWNYILEEGLEDWDEDDYGFYGLPLFKATAVKYGWDNPIGEDSGRERKYDSQY